MAVPSGLLLYTVMTMCDHSGWRNSKCILSSYNTCRVCEVILTCLTWSVSGQHLTVSLQFELWLILVYSMTLTLGQLDIISRDCPLYSEPSSPSILQISRSSGLCHCLDPSPSPSVLWETVPALWHDSFLWLHMSTVPHTRFEVEQSSVVWRLIYF